jgi:DNA-binding PadR family transcriptional regulator
MPNANNDLRNPTDFLPLSPQDFQVLLVLSDRPMHGYGIVKASTDASGKPGLELGSLYRIINRLMDRGLIEDAPAPMAQRDSRRRRRYYRATENGRRVARAEALRLRALLASEHAALLLEDQ